MTIPTHLPIRSLNDRLTNLETAAAEAPRGTYEQARTAASAIDLASSAVMSVFRAHGFKALNDDRLRVVEAAIYGYLLESNPDACGLVTGEGFGAAMDGPNAESVRERAAANRDALLRLTQTESDRDALLWLGVSSPEAP